MDLSHIQADKSYIFAMHLDTQKQRESVLIGEQQQVHRHLLGRKDTFLLIDQKRPFGTFIQDCSKPMTGRIADIRAALCDSTGRKKYAYFEQSKADLGSLFNSDNPVTALWPCGWGRSILGLAGTSIMIC